MSCILNTPENNKKVEALSKETGLEAIVVRNLVGMWQDANNNYEDFPTSNELVSFVNKKRHKEIKVSLSSSGYRKGDPQKNPSVNYVFTDNAEAYIYSTGNNPSTIKVDFPYKSRPKINVSDVNGTNQAGIRTDINGNISTNAYGIVVKKYQQDSNGRFVAFEGQFQDTEDDFKLFIDLNTDLLNRLSASTNKNIVFPTQLALGRAALPKRFAEWLQTYLFVNFSIESTIKENTKSNYNGFGLLLKNIIDTFEDASVNGSNDNTSNNTTKEYEVDFIFDPIVRRDRVTLLSRLFSYEIDLIIKERENTINNRINAENLSESEVNQLKVELQNNTRLQVLKDLTPKGIFDRIKQDFIDYVSLSEEDRIQLELDNINRNKNASKYTDEVKRNEAVRRANHKIAEYNKIIDYFEPLADEASAFFTITEGIKIVNDYTTPSEVNLLEGETITETDKEETQKEGWMSSFKQISTHESLSQEVRKVIRNIPKLDYRGFIEKDDLGNPRFLDADYVHATLIDNLKSMTTSDDMIPLLEELSKSKPWVNRVIKVLQQNESLYSQFYQDFRKDFVQYWIQKKVYNSDGSFKVKTISINKPEGIYYLIDSWRDNYESGTVLTTDSVYNISGEIKKNKAEIGIKLVDSLLNTFNNKSTEERNELIENEENWNNIIKALNMIGINPNPSILKLALLTNKSTDSINYTDPIIVLLQDLHTVFKGIYRGDVKDSNDEEGNTKRGDLINTFGSVYNNIALMLAEVTEDAIESSVREKDKTYYSHVTPSYLGKLIKELKNVRGDKKKFEDFIQKEFKQFDWFFDKKSNHWFNGWLEDLERNSEVRKVLEHKVLLNHDKIEYSDWDSIDYLTILLSEYWSDPNKKTSWYHVPILSDAPSAEFIKFYRYTNSNINEYDINGNRLTYEDVLLDKFTDLVIQEYNRIALVIERDKVYQSDKSSIELIANFDISRDSATGKIKNIGGAEFKFLPQLNNIKYEDGSTFTKRLHNLILSSSGADIRDFIKGTLIEVLEDGFEQEYRKYYDIGLLEELPGGNMKYIPFKGNKEKNSRLAKALNRAKNILGSDFNADMENLLNSLLSNTPYKTREALKLIEDIKVSLSNKVGANPSLNKEVNDITSKLKINDNVKDALREYYWNSKYATSQIIQLTTTDLAFYKNMEDFQKRFKEIHSPALRLNTKAMFNGSLIGRELERTIYLADDLIVSNVAKDIEELILDRFNSGSLTEIEAADIISKYGISNYKDSKGIEYYKIGNTMMKTSKINVADAQAYRSLSSYRAMLGMMGQWTDEMETAYNNLKAGKFSGSDFNILWQPKKPFVYTQVNNNSGIDNTSGIKTPVQHKNSEFLLLAIYNEIAGPLKSSNKLRAINKFMEDNQIDVVQFESTTKVGKQGVIDINGLESEKEILSFLGEITGISKGNENPNFIHTISYEDYGISTATPEHYIDTDQGIGTQIRKLITADMADDIVIKIGNKSLTKAEWLKLYNEVVTENIIQSFVDVDKMFSDPKRIEEELQNEIKGNPRYGQEIARACTLDSNGNFNIPLYDPVQSIMVQQLLNSIIKNRITKQKIKGGSLIQVTSYGLRDDLNIVFEGEGKNKRIKYFECYMPAYTKQFFSTIADEDGKLDISKLDDDLRKLIGYRIPTEDKYSMVPLYIKDFLPMESGSAIMLPAEITTISGSDFDVDKLYIMAPESKIVEYDYASAKKDYDREKRIISELESREIFKHSVFDIDSYTENFKEWFNNLENKDIYKLDKPRVVKVRYNPNKTPKENGTKARNNMIIDLMWGVLTNADTASKILNPGGFDKQKAAARIITILENLSERELLGIINKELGLNLAYRNDGVSVSKYLLQLPLSTLDNISKNIKTFVDPLAPSTQVMYHQYNTTGGKMIGIYANHNANHAFMQHTSLGVDSNNGSFTYNGKTLTSLHAVKNDRGEFISRNTANFLAASVDNVKDNTLHTTNQNQFTGDASMLLSRLGYSPIEIAILMKQPIVVEMTQTYFRESRNGKYKNTIIESVLDKYKKDANISMQFGYDNYKDNPFRVEDLMDNIILAKEMSSISRVNQTSDARKALFYQRQVAVGYLFNRIMSTADALGKLTQATRSDTSGGGAGPTIASSLTKIQKVEDLFISASNSNFPLTGVDTVIRDINTNNVSEDSIREQLLSSNLPILQAFYSLGLKHSENLLSKYFPHFKSDFLEVFDGKYSFDDNGDPKLLFEGLRRMTKSGKLDERTINNIYNDLLAYIMSKTEFFGSEAVKDSSDNVTYITSLEKRKSFINDFPSRFKDIVNRNEDIASLPFISRLKVLKSNDKNPVDVLVFKNVGSLSPILKERFMRDWTTLLYMDNNEARQLALDLFRYSYYRNGFAFGPSSFIHLAPTALRKLIPEYIDTLNKVINTTDYFEEFVEQYIYNHLDNKRLVPEVPEDSSVSFVDSDFKFKNTVTFEITSGSNSSDKSVVKNTIKIQDSDALEYEFFKFISRRYKGQYAYYRINPESSNSSNVAVYERIEPLGYKNSFIEYQYGVKAEDMESAIAKNKKDYEPNVDAIANSIPQEPDYNSDGAGFPDDSEAFLKSIGEYLGFSSVEDMADLNNEKPNIDYKDANDLPTCKTF